MRGEVYKKYYQRNIRIKKVIAQEDTDGDTLYVFSHSHLAEEDLEYRYINTGMIRGGKASYVWIEDGKIELRRETY